MKIKNFDKIIDVWNHDVMNRWLLPSDFCISSTQVVFERSDSESCTASYVMILCTKHRCYIYYNHNTLSWYYKWFNVDGATYSRNSIPHFVINNVDALVRYITSEGVYGDGSFGPNFRLTNDKP